MNYKTEIYKLVSEMCHMFGMNTAHDWDGIETDSDVILYKKSVLKKIRKLLDDNLTIIKEGDRYNYNENNDSRNVSLVEFTCKTVKVIEGAGTFYDGHHHIWCHKI